MAPWASTWSFEMGSMLKRSLSLLSIAALVIGAGVSCNLDPVHRADVNALGDEEEGLYPPESEFHRPGQPCAVCHSSKGPADSTFVLAGTVYWGPDNPDRRVDKAYVRVLDANKVKRCFVTNCNGNFFVRPDDFPKLTFPLLISVERTKDPGKDETTMVFRQMNGHIGREPSCANCHQQIDGVSVRDFASPGQIRLMETEEQVRTQNVPVTNPCDESAPRVAACPEERL